jgi:tetratricopeptide (TPR) repeat protein
VKEVTARQFGFTLFLALVISLALTKTLATEVNSWATVCSEHFVFVGDVGQSELESLSTNLEQFRAVFQQLLPNEYFDARVPLVIIVFANSGEYTPFKPLHEGVVDSNVAGYFRAAHDFSYITLAAGDTIDETNAVLYHEYMHSLLRNKYGRVPLWLGEGLAEYYSTYYLAALAGGSQQVRLGKPLSSRAQYLRTHALLPLSTLLTVDQSSSLYNDHDKRGIFYAQSWVLAHYFMSDRTGERQRQLAEFLKLSSEGANVEASLRQAFKVETVTLEQRLAAYVRAGQYSERTEKLAQPLAPAKALTTRTLNEAEVLAQLGDLLLRTDRPEEARTYLQKALALDSNLAAAHISLGLLYLEQGNITEAKDQLQQAVAADPKNYLAHYYYAHLLSLDGSESGTNVAGYIEKTSHIRGELKKSIELAPDFLDAYGFLILTDIERNPQLDEATEALDFIVKRAPGRREFELLQAQLNLRKEQFDTARAQLQSLIGDMSIDPLLRTQAKQIFDSIPGKEKLAAQRRGETAAVALQEIAQPCDMPEPGPQIKSQRFAGSHVCGQLVRVECSDAGAILFVKAGERTIKLHTDALNRVRFVTYTSEIRGKVECGERRTPEPVLVTYRPRSGDQLSIDGDLMAVEFVPAEWVH